jgi:hypothetical protein
MAQECQDASAVANSLSKACAAMLAMGCIFAGLGCERLQQARECRRLSQAVNPALENIQKAYGHAARDPKTYLDAAKRYEQLSAKLVTLKFSKQELYPAVTDYASLLESGAAQARLIAGILERKDQNALEAKRREFAAISTRERTAVQRLNALCSER